MRTISKKILSLMLVAVLVLSAVPFAAFADDVLPEGEPAPAAEGAPELVPAPASEGTPDPVPNPSGSTDEVEQVTVKFYLVLGDTPIGPVSLESKKGVLPAAPSAGNKVFSDGIKTEGLSLSDFESTSGLKWNSALNGTGKAYPAGQNINQLEGIDTFYAVVKEKVITVTVQVTWTANGKTINYELDSFKTPVKDAKNVIISDFLYGKPDGALTDVDGGSHSNDYTAEVKTRMESGSFGDGYDVTGFVWKDDVWTANGTKVVTQKFSGSNVTLQAKLTADKVTVDFEDEDAHATKDIPANSNVPTNAVYPNGLPTPTVVADGWVFVGWFDKAQDSEDLAFVKGRVSPANGAKQYFNNTVFTEDITLHAWYAKEANITLHVYNKKSTEASDIVSEVTLSGIPVGSDLTKAQVTAALVNTGAMKGPYKDGTSSDARETWEYFVNIGTYPKEYLPKELTDAAYELAVYASNLKASKPDVNVTENYNNVPGSSSSGGSGSNGSSGSSAASDPSNPKTGDAQRTELNAAAIVLAVATVALTVMTSVMFIRRKYEI